MGHIVNESADRLLDVEHRVLDKGFVRLVDYLGGDARIVQAARVSYGEGTKSVREDAALIDYLLRNNHTSPFEQVVLTFHIKMPIFVARQWVRHRTARLNEVSARYSVLRDEFYLPDAKSLRLQSTSNRQARGNRPLPAAEAESALERMSAGQQQAYQDYHALLAGGLAREVARLVLPVSVYTEVYWQMDLNNLFRFLALRLDAHAQAEIRAYASVIAEITRTVAPEAFFAFERYHLGGVALSAAERTWLRDFLEQQDSLDDTGKAVQKKLK